MRFYSQEQYDEHQDELFAEANYDAAYEDRREAEEAGYLRPDSQWLTTSRDQVVKNPFYQGPDQPHPEVEPEDFYSSLDELITD